MQTPAMKIDPVTANCSIYIRCHIFWQSSKTDTGLAASYQGLYIALTRVWWARHVFTFLFVSSASFVTRKL